jgi:GNAT superfamily N-acetyltransferase
VSDQVVIRRARADELDAVGRLTADTYVSDGFITSDNTYVEVLRDAASRAANAELWVAVLDGEVVGTVTFCPPGSTYRQASADSEGEFRALAVSTGARGIGIGRRLVEQCLDRCRAFGLRQLVLLSQDEMRSAHRLYAALGFTRDEALDLSPQPGVTLRGFRADVPPDAERR